MRDPLAEELLARWSTPLWRCVDARVDTRGVLTVQAVSTADGGSIDIDILPRDTMAKVACRLKRIAFRYRWTASGDRSERDNARAFIEHVASDCDATAREPRWTAASALDNFALAAPAVDPCLVAPVDAGAPLEISLDSDCEQRCEFCGIHAVYAPRDGGVVAFERWSAALARHRAAGGTEFALKGIDPLTYSRVI